MARADGSRTSEEELLFLQDLTREGLSLGTLGGLWPFLEKRLVSFFHCDRATLYLVDGDKLRSMFARGLDSPIVVSVGEGIAGHVARSRKPVIVNDPYKDRRFNSGYDRKTGYRTRNLACVAFVHEKQAVGVLELLNRPGGFSQEDERSLEAISPQVGFVIAKLRADDLNLELRQTLDQAGKVAALGMLVGGVAHELGSPMTALQAALDRLVQSAPAPMKKDLENAKRQAQRCQGIVRNLLGFARRAEFDLEAVQLSDQLGPVLALVRDQAAIDRVEIDADVPDSLPRVHAAPNQLQQVFLNLIVNAFKAMPAGGRLTIRARADRDRVTLTFKDQGEGISAADMKRIFTPFFTTSKEGGTGLGLSICRDLVARFGGTLEARSEGKGKGAEFLLTLKKA